jgi:hypothetical protein
VKVGGGLNYVVGPMGCGKTLFAAREIIQTVARGRYVVSNVRLGHYEGKGRKRVFVPSDEWATRAARHYAWLGSRGSRAAVRDMMLRHYVYCESIDEARWYWPAKELRTSPAAEHRFIWDEGHNDLNNRSHRARDARFKNAGTDGNELLEWATQLRKLGFVAFLLSQHEENTDAQLRRVCNFIVRLQNQKEQVRYHGMRVTPIALFLARWYPAHTADKGRAIPPVKTDRYFLTWHKRTYDTLGLYHGLAGGGLTVDDRVRWLPAGGVPRASVAALELGQGADI